MYKISLLKKFLSSFKYSFVLLCFCSYAQTWVSTDFTPFDFFSISDVESHNGNLFATYSTGVGAVLSKSENDGATWTELNLDGITGFPTLLLSAGDRLYLSTLNIVDSHLYYSIDGGVNFIEDINGLPPGILGGASLINRLQYMDNRVVVGLGGAGYYQKPMSNPSGDFTQFDTPTGLNSGSDRLVFFNGNLFTYDNAGAFSFYQSTDFGSNWTIPISNGLPANLNSEILAINPITGRIYISGVFDSDSQYGLYFTDDLGTNWSQFDLSMVASTNYLGDFHKVTALYANGPLFFAALDNDMDMSYPDVISSIDLSSTDPTVDVQGLPENAPGAVFGNKIIVHKSKPLIALNLIDIFIKDQTLGVNDKLTSSNLKIYPTQTEALITIESNGPFHGSIYDQSGKLIMKVESLENTMHLNVGKLSKGLYIIHLTDDKGLMVAKKFLKNN